MIDPDVLADYDKWLHAVANRMLANRPSEADHQDLVQEGRVAMWRALSTFDESKGALPSWLTKAAEMRMRDIAWGSGQPFGREATRGVRNVEEGPSMDDMDEDQVEALLGHVEEAFHDGEILRTIREVLTPTQQQYVFLRFWGGLDPRSMSPGTREVIKQFPIMRERGHWEGARAVLRERLAHLAPEAA